VIPAGVVIEIPQLGPYSDPALFDDPGLFDALRFYKLRQTKSNAVPGAKAAEVVANSQFVSVGSSSLTFGAGRHACPGRFFAANEIKMIIATVLMHYEIKNPDDVMERHENLIVGSSVRGSPQSTRA
jgi:cytochrome P450